MKSLTETEFNAFIGLDWADTKHDLCLQSPEGGQREFSRISHRVGDIEDWAQALQQRFNGPIAIALELAKGPTVYALQKYDFFVLFAINPAMLAKYRQAFSSSGAKDDPTDAELALELLLNHRDKLTALNPQSAPMRSLIYLVEQRRRLVADKVRLNNRLIQVLKQYYPQPLE